MESYCAIIEGLVSMMIATGALPSQPPQPPPQQQQRTPLSTVRRHELESAKRVLQAE